MTSHCSTFPLYVIPHLQPWQLQLPVTLLQKGKCFEMMNYISVGEPQTSVHLSLAIIPLWLLLSPLTHSPGFIFFSSPKGIPGLPCPTLPHQRVPQPHIRAHQVKNFKTDIYPIEIYCVRGDCSAVLLLGPSLFPEMNQFPSLPFQCPPISHTCKSWTKWHYATPFYPAHPWPSAITFFSSKSSTPHLYGGTPGQWWPTDTAPFKIFSFQELLHSSSITE